MGLTITDSEIKNAIGDLIDDAVSAFYTSQGKTVKARIHRRWTLSHNVGESSALLKALEGEYRGKVHCWMIGTGSYKRIRPLRGGESLLNLAINGSLKQQQPDVRYVVKQYKIWAYLQLDTGDDITNSENRLVSELEYVANHLSHYPKLSIASEDIKGHGELNFDNIDTYKFGEIQVNVAQGTLDVYLFESL